MKNQYFADINDYQKYCLLRILAGKNGEMKIAICWMLTNNDTRKDGKFLNYLDCPDQCKKYDPYLFDSLASSMANPLNRSIKWVEDNHLIPSAVYFSELLLDDREKRQGYFANFHAIVANTDLVFFDPDNGIECKSAICGRKGSNKYIYWSELTNAFASGQSILVYQHFIRMKRETFTKQLVDEFRKRLNISDVITFTTARVLYLLVPQPRHQHYLTEKCAEITKNGCCQIKMAKLKCAQPPAEG